MASWLHFLGWDRRRLFGCLDASISNGRCLGRRNSPYTRGRNTDAPDNRYLIYSACGRRLHAEFLRMDASVRRDRSRDGAARYFHDAVVLGGPISNLFRSMGRNDLSAEWVVGETG